MEKITCPKNLAWAKSMCDLFPPGWSKKIDALRECIRAAEEAKKEKEEVKEEIKVEEEAGEE